MSSLKSGAGVFQGTLLTELPGCVDFSGVARQGSGSASCAVLLTFPLQQGTPCHGGGGVVVAGLRCLSFLSAASVPGIPVSTATVLSDALIQVCTSRCSCFEFSW